MITVSNLASFAVYMLAMTGVIAIALVVWKLCSNNGMKKFNSMIKIEDSLSLNYRKSIFVIKVRNERFLIASDADRTTLLAKLEEGEIPSFQAVREKQEKHEKEEKQEKHDKHETQEKPEAAISQERNKKAVNILKELTKDKMNIGG